ncbi:MAG TPA: insulinase family protein [Candidatus Polarisedimenticolaceae bacterium]|nr:insulinase family protein [Candidatus Polarisedimenticolaceae bacterium]
MRSAALLLLLAARPAAALESWAIDPATTGLLVEDHRAPLLEVEIEFPAGTWSPWVQQHDADEAFEIQLYDPQAALRRRADALAATVSLSSGDRGSTLSLSCHKDDAAAALELVRQILGNREFDRGELARRRQSEKLEWVASSRQPQFALAQAAARILFAEGDPRRRPYERPRPATSDVARLVAARDVLVRLPGRVVGFAGDVTLDQAQHLAQDLLPAAGGEAPPDLAPRLSPVVPAEHRPRATTVRLPRLTQAYMAYGRESLRWIDPEYAASQIADHALGGHFNSRLMLALRQEGGDTYGASVNSEGTIDPDAYALISYSRTENAPALERKLREVLARFRSEGILESERLLAAGAIVGRRALDHQTPGSLLREALTERRYGLPYGFFETQAKRAAALTLDEVNAFIRSFYDPARFTLVTLIAQRPR